MIPVQELCKTLTYQQAHEQLPALQERVFNCLRELTPNFLAFEFKQDLYSKLKFNFKEIDSSTNTVIVYLLKDQLEDNRTLLTSSDIRATHQRICELLFIKQAVDQGIIIEKFDDSNQSRYFIKNDLPVVQQRRKAILSPSKWRTQYGVSNAD